MRSFGLFGSLAVLVVVAGCSTQATNESQGSSTAADSVGSSCYGRCADEANACFADKSIPENDCAYSKDDCEAECDKSSGSTSTSDE